MVRVMLTTTDTLTYCFEELGWSFTPLHGKKPCRPGWQREDRVPIDEIFAHIAAGGNVGLRTGAGVVVIDCDPGADDLKLPPTVTVSTPRGGRHYYFRYDGSLGNSVGKLAPHVDVRADRGQVACPPSDGYQWVRSPVDVDLADLPDWIVDALDRSAAPATPSNGTVRPYVRAALKLAADAVRNAPEGTRNDTLNREAFSMFGFAPHEIGADEVAAAMGDAAIATGLSGTEVAATLASARAGMQHPRQVPEMATEAAVLVPGAHTTADGEYIEVGVAAFATAVLGALPGDLIYRRAQIPGEITGDPGKRKWNPLTVNRARLMVDGNITLKSWVKSRDDGEPALVFRYCTKDLGGVVLAGAESHPGIRDIEFVTPFPVFDRDWRLSPPGWSGGIYYDEPPALAGMTPETDFETIHSTLSELVIDFPFLTNADRHNYFGLLLTPIILPAVRGNRPLHIITAPIPRTGKSKLAEDVLGGILTGQKTPALQITGTDDERDKRITGLLLQDEIVVHLDNLPPKLDSPALASLLTASVYQSRILGASKIVSLPNNLVLVGTGNNVECSTEIAKRCVPIRLQPKGPNPERRTNFHYPNLWDHVSGSRRKILSCLIGMVENWIEKGRPKGTTRIGGFESWSESIGGILHVNGFHEWMKNASDWLENSDADTIEMTHFVTVWADRLGTHWVSTGQILDAIQGTEVFEWIFSRKDPKRLIGRILSNYTDAPIDKYIIRKRRGGSGMEYRLCENVNYI